MYRALSVFLLGACSPYSPDLGNAPYLCSTSEPRCPSGYACEVVGTQNVCVDSDGNAPTDANSTDAPPQDGSGACASSFTGVLATWTLTGQPGTQASTAAASSASGVTAGALTRGGALTPAAGTNSISSSGWSTGALDKTKFYTVTLTAPSGCSLTTMSLALDATSSGTGPTSSAIATSADAFAVTTPGSTTTATNVSLAASGSMLEIRIYGIGASATTGTMRVQNTFSVTGAVQ